MVEITTKTALSLYGDVTTTCTCEIAEDLLETQTAYQLTGSTTVACNLYLQETFLLRKIYIDLYSIYKDYTHTLQLTDFESQYRTTLQLLETHLSKYARLFLSSGAIPPHINPFKKSAFLFLISREYDRLKAALFQTSRYLVEKNTMNLISTSGVSATDTVLLVDELGPEIFNEIPVSGSLFNNPSTGINFDLIDTGRSDIYLGSVNLYINGTQVISGGSSVSPSGFGIASLTHVTDYYYVFNFEPEVPFDANSLVSVSGNARDSTGASGNTNYYFYEFSVWKTDDLTATISGAPDILAPYLDNVSPPNLSVEIPVDSSISFDIVDEHTGLKFTSVQIAINGEPLVVSGLAINPDYNISITSISGGLGNSYVINPNSNLSFDSLIEISIYAEDLFIPSNVLDTTIIFYTQANSHLLASGLNIMQEASYIEMEVEESYTSYTGTQFVIDYINTSGIPIDISGSYIALNENIISTTFVQASGTPDHYKVYFELEPNYETDANLLFHVQQSGSVYGNIVYRDFETRLLWGYQVCQTDDNSFEYNKEIVTLIQLTDFANYNTLGSLAYKFTTEPLHQVGLRGSINGLPLIYSEMLGQIMSNNPFHEYGKTMRLKLEASDYAGNKLEYEWEYTIEDSP